MIVVRLAEGLGNQMFQYAAGRALSLRTGQDFRLDLSWYRGANGRRRSYGLDAFDLDVAPVDEALRRPLRELRESVGTAGGARPGDATGDGAGDTDTGLTLYGEIFHDFRPQVVDAPGDAYLCGHWQSERYFQDQAEAVRDDFTFADPLTAEGARAAARVTECVSVAVHVRRGDYAENALVHAVMGVCPTEYYLRAVPSVNDATGADGVFVFTDDPAWVRTELLPRLPGAVLLRGATDVEDLRLMSLCRHHVIANSTFGWWGAWLAERPGQMVVAPERWMQRPLGTTAHIVPERWLRM